MKAVLKGTTIQSSLRFFTNLKVAIFILLLIALSSSIGSFIEQDESRSFYEELYPQTKPIYGFIDVNFILTFELNHIYRSWWFLLLLVFLAISLISCTMTQQFPLFLTSKDYFFKKKEDSFVKLPFFVKLPSFYYLNELLVTKIQTMNYIGYQKQQLFYAYKGLIGRLSPIFVHFSLLLILGGATFGAFENFKAQEILPKGELFHIQNPVNVGWITTFPSFTTRVNDFWVDYENNKIHQFYSNLSILDAYGQEVKTQTISVNNPLHYQNIDIYQSDWNVLGLRLFDNKLQTTYEYPFFPLKGKAKAWITWIDQPNLSATIVVDQLQNTFLVYDNTGQFISQKEIGDFLSSSTQIIDFLPSTGLLIKFDPSIVIIYLGFGCLMITTLLSYLPYTQLWIVSNYHYTWIGGLTNRGKIQLEVEFEQLIRYGENILVTFFLSKRVKK